MGRVLVRPEAEADALGLPDDCITPFHGRAGSAKGFLARRRLFRQWIELGL